MKNPDQSVGYTTPQKLYMTVVGGEKGAFAALDTLAEIANGGDAEARKLVNMLDEAVSNNEISVPTE